MTALSLLLLVAAVAALALGGRRRPSRDLYEETFRAGPLWAWCPEECRSTPHRLDAGGRTCRSCKTFTPLTTEESRD